MLVQGFLEESAQRRPNKLALVCNGSRLTYREIDDMANRLANSMLAGGVKRGDRVAICLNNSVEAVVSVFAILKAGATFVFVNRSTKEDKLVYILNNCRATILITDERLLDDDLLLRVNRRVASLKASFVSAHSKLPAVLPPGCHDYASALDSSSPRRPACTNIDLDLACLIYTSGSTGEPKGVMCDHGNAVFAASSIITYLGNAEDDVVINVLPLSFDYGLYQLLMTFKFGGTLVLERGFTYPAAVLKRIEEEKVTGLPGVPTLFALLISMDLSPFNLSTLRYITNTAAALPPNHIMELRRKFPRAVIYSMYGLTETKRALYLPPALLDEKPGSVGLAIPGTEVWIEDDAGSRVGPGVVGELVVRGRHVMRGYWEAPEATAIRFRPGPFLGERLCFTGDLFRMDGDGCMYFVSRRDDIIKTRGEKVAPKEVENVLYSMEGIREVAVVGIPDPVLGQAVKVFLVSDNAELTADQVIAYCRANLEDFMVPKHVEFRDALPKTFSGKITKTALQDNLA